MDPVQRSILVLRGKMTNYYSPGMAHGSQHVPLLEPGVNEPQLGSHSEN